MEIISIPHVKGPLMLNTKIFITACLLLLPAANVFSAAFGDASASIDWSTFKVDGDIQITGTETYYWGETLGDTFNEHVTGWPEVFKFYSEPGAAQAAGLTDEFIETTTSTKSKNFVHSSVSAGRLIRFTALTTGYVETNLDYFFLQSAFKDDPLEWYASSSFLSYDIYNEVETTESVSHSGGLTAYHDAGSIGISGTFFETLSGSAVLRALFNAGDTGYIIAGANVITVNEGSFMEGTPVPFLYNDAASFTSVPEPSANFMLAAAFTLFAAVRMKRLKQER